MDHKNAFLHDLIRDQPHQDWLIISLLLLTIAYLVVKLIYGKYWKRYRQAILYSQEAQKLTHEKNVLLLQAAIMLNVLAVISIGLFVFIFLDHFSWIDNFPPNFSGWVYSSSAFALLVIVKYFVNHILGLTGNNIAVSSQVNHQWLINLKNFGFFVLPISFVATFIIEPLNVAVLYIGFAILLIMLIMNYVKGFMVLFQHRISIYYGILYLCTLEILPILIIWKVIKLMME